MKKILILVLVLVGCNERLETSNVPTHIRCYSGGSLVYECDSVEAPWSGGEVYWTFRNSKTGKAVRVMGTCIAESE